VQNSIWKRAIVIGVIILFVGVNVISSTRMVNTSGGSTNGGNIFNVDRKESLSYAYPQEIICEKFYGIEWDVTLNITETSGKYDYVVFGEAPDANDGPPHDDYDSPKPPAPMEPYIRAWFYDNMEPPYNLMFDDYRVYPDIRKVWNLTVIWVDDFPPQETTLTISWDNNEFIGCEYDFVILYDIENEVEVDMKIDSFYEFTCPSDIKQDFTINCSLIINQPPDKPTIDGPSYGQPGMPYIFCIEATDPDGDNVYCIWDWGDGTYTDWLGPYASGETICKEHGWIETGIYEIRIKVKDEYGSESGWSEPFIITIEDELPYLDIIMPEKRTFYLNYKDRIIFQFPFLFTLIFGKMDIEVHALDEISGINKVEFYIDDDLRYNDTAEPYNWTWDERKFFRHKITVIAYDYAGNYDSDEVKVRKFF